jgi:transposase
MTAIKKTTRKRKRGPHFEEAQSLFLAGKSLEEIQEILPVALQTLKRWQREGQWEEKRRQVPISPRWLGEALKGILREKAGKLLAKGDLKPQELEELTKIITLIDRLCSQGWDIRAAALEVMDRFSEFLRGWVTDQEELKRISHRMQEFFRQLEDENGLGS